MGLFKKKQQPPITEKKCPAQDCPETFTDLESLRRHVEWKHPELANNIEKSEKLK